MGDRSADNEASNKLLYWIAGLIGTALIALFSIVYGGLSARVDKIEDNGTPKSREEISKLKSDITNIKENIATIKDDQREILLYLKTANENGNPPNPKRR